MSYDKKVQLNLNNYQISTSAANDVKDSQAVAKSQKTTGAEALNSIADNEYIDVNFDENNEAVAQEGEKTSASSDVDENEVIIKQLEAEIEKLEAEYKASQSGKGIAGSIGGFFSSCKNALAGKGFKDTAKVELDEKIALLNSAKADPSKLQEAYSAIMGADLTDEVRASALEAQSVADSLSNEEKQVIVETLQEQAASLQKLMEESKDNQGWFSKAMGGINNVMGFGTNSKCADAKVQDFINQVNSLNPDDPDFAQKYQALTGEALTLDGIDELFQGVSKVGNSEAAEAIMDYEETQDSLKEVGAGIVTGLAVAACVIAAPFTGGASIALGAAVGGAANVLIKGTDTIGTDEKYSLEQGVLDFGGGAINGAVTAMTMGSANLAGKGFSAIKGSGTAAAKKGAEQVVSGGVKNAAKSAFTGFGKSAAYGAKIAAFSTTSNYMLNTVGTNALYEATGNYAKAETPSNIVQNDDGTYSVYYELTDSNTGKVVTYEIETVESLSQDENGNLVKGNVLAASRANDFNVGDLAKQNAVSVGSAVVGSGIGKVTGNIINPYATTMTNSVALGNVFEIASDMSLSLGADYLIESARAGQFADKDEFFSWDRILGEGRNQIRGLLIGIATSKVNNYGAVADDALGAGVGGKSVDMADVPTKTSGDVKLDTVDGADVKMARSQDGAQIKINDTEVPKTQQQILETAGKLILEENNPAKAGELLSSCGMKQADIETFFEETIKVKQETGLTDGTKTQKTTDGAKTQTAEAIESDGAGRIDSAKTQAEDSAKSDISAQKNNVAKQEVEDVAEMSYFKKLMLLKHSGFKAFDAIKNARNNDVCNNAAILKNAGLGRYAVVNLAAKSTNEQIQNAVTLKNAGISDYQVEKMAIEFTDEQIQNAVTLKNAGVNDLDIKDFTIKLTTEQVQNAATLKNAGIGDHHIVGLATKLTNEQVQNAAVLRKAGIDDYCIGNLATNLKDEQINGAIALKNAGIDDYHIENLATKLTGEQFQNAAILKNGGFGDYRIEYFATRLNGEQAQNAAILKNGGFVDYYIEKFATMLTNEQAQNAVILKNGGIDDYHIEYMATKLKGEQVQNAVILKKGGINDNCIDLLAMNLKGEQINNAVTLKNAGVNDFYIANIATLDGAMFDNALKFAYKGVDGAYIKDLANLEGTEFDNALKFADKGVDGGCIKDLISLEGAKFEKALKLADKGACGYDIKDLVNLEGAEFDTALNIIDKGVDSATVRYLAREHGDKLGKLLEKIDLGLESNDLETYAKVLTQEDFDTSSLASMTVRDKIDLRTRIVDQIALLKTSANYEKVFSAEEISQHDILCEKIEASLNKVITTTDVSKDDILQGMKGFFANNNPAVDDVIKNADFTKYGKEGIPLEYSRSEFLSDVSNALKDVSDSERKIIINKLGIEAIEADGKITGYDGIVDLTKLSSDGIEGEVLNLANRFIKNNSVKTGDVELDNSLNSLIKAVPEFVNTIGKQQHDTQALSLDSHILTVYKEALSSEEYKDLSNLDKTCLKWATILHDIAKSEGVVDKSHPQISSFYAKDIMKKYALNVDIRNRIGELVKNHHWLEEYSTAGNANKIASYFRHKDDYSVAKIMASADLKGVSDQFYQTHSSALTKENLDPISSSFDNINKTGQLMFTTKVVAKDLVPKEEYNGATYKVINFAALDGDEDLSKYGFAPNTTPKSTRLFVHMNNNASGLETLENLANVSDGAFLCASYVSPDKCPTYGNQNFGVSLEAENINIANFDTTNQASGYGKDFNNFSDIITGKSGYLSDMRTNQVRVIKNSLNIDDAEYSELYRQIADKKYATAINDDDIFTAGSKQISGYDVKTALNDLDNYIMENTAKDNRNQHNEANLFMPTVNALVARVNTLDEVPQEFLNFAKKHDLPIYLLGRY